mmetsp:Transcript_93122/g.272524  ORF Transcript_93122/g.272524 Transcript_93122/m.272524 type:complete len:277 (+) Transcript_93122:2-832(+)
MRHVNGKTSNLRRHFAGPSNIAPLSQRREVLMMFCTPRSIRKSEERCCQAAQVSTRMTAGKHTPTEVQSEARSAHHHLKRYLAPSLALAYQSSKLRSEACRLYKALHVSCTTAECCVVRMVLKAARTSMPLRLCRSTPLAYLSRSLVERTPRSVKRPSSWRTLAGSHFFFFGGRPSDCARPGLEEEAPRLGSMVPAVLACRGLVPARPLAAWDRRVAPLAGESPALAWARRVPPLAGESAAPASGLRALASWPFSLPLLPGLLAAVRFCDRKRVSS